MILESARKSGKKIILVFDNEDPIEFYGKYLPEREKPNWHYYATDDGIIIHCRKEHMVCVIEKVDE